MKITIAIFPKEIYNFFPEKKEKEKMCPSPGVEVGLQYFQKFYICVRNAFRIRSILKQHHLEALPFGVKGGEKVLSGNSDEKG